MKIPSKTNSFCIDDREAHNTLNTHRHYTEEKNRQRPNQFRNRQQKPLI